MMMQDPWSSTAVGIRPSKSAPCSPIKPILPMMRSESFHIAHKVPIGDTPYVRAKRVQLVDKDPEKAIALFWAAINAGDRIDSALKDMAIVMKQQNRAEEAIEAIRSLRSRCSEQAQESLDNILLDLYKKCGRLDDQIALLKHKLHLIQQGVAFNGKRTKTARSQGRKFQVSLEQEATRLLGNLGWALMQQDNYAEAETAYRRALLIGPDSNKMCNLGICLMKQGRVAEAKETLKRVRPAMADGPRGVDSHLKAFERAQEMIQDLETKLSGGSGLGKADRLWPAEIFFMGSSSSVWQPQPCLDFGGLQDAYGDENVDVNRMPTTRTNSSSSIKAEQLPSSLLGNPLNKMAAITRTNSNSSIKAEQLPSSLLRKPLNKMAATTRTSTSSITTKPELPSSLLGNPLNVAAAPFFSRLVKKPEEVDRFQDPLGNLKRTRSAGEAMGRSHTGAATREKPEKPATGMSKAAEPQAGMGNKWLELLPDNDAFDEAIVAAVLAPVLEEGGEEAMAAQGSNNPALLGGGERNVGKRLRVFEDITHCLSPRA